MKEVKKQKAASERPERPIPTNRERAQHVVVEAPGVTGADLSQAPDSEKNQQGVFESKGESGKREVKKSGATLGSHVTSKSGAEVSADRSKEVKSTRIRRETANFGS